MSTVTQKTHGSRWLRNCWYVAAWSHELDASGLTERTILGESLLLYRKADGSPVVLANRCCHRYAPLSKGRREGDCVRCMYHGLRYDASGACVEIPGQETIPPKARVRAYPAVEQRRWVWVWMGNPELADPSLIPDAYSLDDPGWRMKPGYLHYDVQAQLVIDNLLDFSHLSYVHEESLGGTAAIAEARPLVEKIERGLRITRSIERSPPSPAHRKLGEFPDEIDRWWIYDFLVPGILLMESGVTPAGHSRSDPAARLFHSCQAVTPETERSTHYFFALAHAFALDDPRVTEATAAALVQAFEEDRQIITAQQAMIEAAPADAEPMMPIAADRGVAQYRRLVAQMLEVEASDGSKSPERVDVQLSTAATS